MTTPNYGTLSLSELKVYNNSNTVTSGSLTYNTNNDENFYMNTGLDVSGNITIKGDDGVNGIIFPDGSKQTSASSGGDVSLTESNTFTGTNTFDVNVVTCNAGLDVSENVDISGNIDLSGNLIMNVLGTYIQFPNGSQQTSAYTGSGDVVTTDGTNNFTGTNTFDVNVVTCNAGLDVNGNIIMDVSGTYIQFPDGSTQTSAASGGDVSLTQPNTFTGTNEFQSTFTVNNALTNIGQVGTNNTVIGKFALTSLEGGADNTAFGISALTNLTSGSNNVGIGENSNFNVVTGDNNIAIGSNTGVGGDTPDTLSNTIAIGKNITSQYGGDMIFGFKDYNVNGDYWAKFTPNSTNNGITLEGIYNGSRNFTITAPTSSIYLDAPNINLNGTIQSNNTFSGTNTFNGDNGIRMTKIVEGETDSGNLNYLKIGDSPGYFSMDKGLELSGTLNIKKNFLLFLDTTIESFQGILKFDNGTFVMDKGLNLSGNLSINGNVFIPPGNSLNVGSDVNASTTNLWGRLNLLNYDTTNRAIYWGEANDSPSLKFEGGNFIMSNGISLYNETSRGGIYMNGENGITMTRDGITGRLNFDNTQFVMDKGLQVNNNLNINNTSSNLYPYPPSIFGIKIFTLPYYSYLGSISYYFTLSGGGIINIFIPGPPNNAELPATISGTYAYGVNQGFTNGSATKYFERLGCSTNDPIITLRNNGDSNTFILDVYFGPDINKLNDGIATSIYFQFMGSLPNSVTQGQP